MNVPEYPYFVYLPSAPPTPPPGEPIDSPLASPREIDPVLDTPQEIEKWLNARKKQFPTKTKVQEDNEADKVQVKRGDLSKLEIRMRKRMALMKKFYKKTEERPGKNPFLKFMHLRKKLTNNTVLKEQRILLQCIRYVVENGFFDSDT